jgi:hypothetical protein
MGKGKWRAGRPEEEEEPSFFMRYRNAIVIAVIAIAAIGFFIYRFNNSKYRYGDASSEYNRALAACMNDRTQNNVASAAVEDAAEACVRDTPAPPGTP